LSQIDVATLPLDTLRLHVQCPVLTAAAVCLSCCCLVSSNPAVYNSFKANAAVLKASDAASDSSTSKVVTESSSNRAASAFVAPAARGVTSFRLPKTDIDQRFILESTQPIIKANGMLRWALGSVAHAATPPCKPVLDSIHADTKWAEVNAVQAGGAANALNTAAYWGQIGGDAASLAAAQDARLQVSGFRAVGASGTGHNPLPAGFILIQQVLTEQLCCWHLASRQLC
jgi:hypothetical protein